MGRRVCFVNRYCYPDGSATSQLLTDLAGELSVRGWQVTIIGGRQRYDDPEAELPLHDRWRGVDIHRVVGTRFGRASLPGRMVDYASFFLGSLPVLWRNLRRGDVVVAKTDPPLLCLAVAPVAWLRGATLVNWLQDLFPEVAVALGQPKVPALLAGFLRRLRNRTLRRAAANVVIGARMREHLEAQGIPDASIACIPNWPHEDAIRPMKGGESHLRSRLGLQDRFVVGYSGNLGRVHEWEPLFDAARRLQSKAHIAFLIGGGGHGYDALKRAVAEAALENVIFQPYHPMEFLSDSMAAADLHLVSLRPALEGLVVPSKFYGIAAAARPIGFVGDCEGELARLIREYDCGFNVPAGRGDLLADSIEAMSHDPALVRSQGARARAMLDTRFSRASAHEEWNRLLSRLTAEGQP